jgi:hypothetical protein
LVRAQLLSQTLDCSESLSVEYTVANQPEMTVTKRKKSFITMAAGLISSLAFETSKMYTTAADSLASLDQVPVR